MSAEHLTPQQKEQLTDDLVLRVVTLLAGYDGTSTLSSSAIAKCLDVEDGPTHPVIRAAIGEALRRGLAPICATSLGYFIARTDDDVERYVADLRGRSAAILARAANVERARDIREGQAAKEAKPEVHWIPEPEEVP